MKPTRKKTHVLYNFRLEPQVDPLTKDMTVIAHLPEAQLQALEPIESNEQRLHHVYVCSADGRLDKSIAFTESDYRETLNDYINGELSDDVVDTARLETVTTTVSSVSFIISRRRCKK